MTNQCESDGLGIVFRGGTETLLGNIHRAIQRGPVLTSMYYCESTAGSVQHLIGKAQASLKRLHGPKIKWTQ